MTKSFEEEAEALCVHSLTARLVGYFYEKGKVHQMQTTLELWMVGLVVALSWGMVYAHRAGSWVWMALIGIVLFVVVVICLRPVIIAVTGYRYDRRGWKRDVANVPSALESQVYLASTYTPRQGELKGVVAQAQQILDQLMAKTDARFVLRALTYVLKNREDRKTLGDLLLLMALYDNKPDIFPVGVGEAVSRTRVALVKTFGEAMLADALGEAVRAAAEKVKSPQRGEP
jgi:hypothetical protein